MTKRYEKKFLLPLSQLANLETVIKLHPSLFREIYHQRSIHNIYFDTQRFNLFEQNIDGNSQRLKIRLRWYEDRSSANNPQLEFKIRTGLLNQKEIFSANSFNLHDTVPNIGTLLSKPNNTVIQKLKSVQPVMMNTYDRKYFQSHDGKFRLTIDQNLDFFHVSNNKIYWQKKYSMPATILELKYDHEYDDLADKITSFFPFRITKSSKYTIGVSNLYNYDY